MFARLTRTWRSPGLRAFSEAETPLTEIVRDFLRPQVFYEQLQQRGFDFFTGVPDSLLYDFLNYVSEVHPAEKNVIAVNEGAAIGIASGWHLATRRYPMVFMQSAGVGNAVNPLISLTHAKIYKIPMVLFIGWRGEPGKKDEPQHKVQGSVIMPLLETLGVKYEVLPDFEEGSAEALDNAKAHLDNTGSPYAFMVRRRTFVNYESETPESKYSLSREDALQLIVDNIGNFDAVISTAGFTSRELFSIRSQRKDLLNPDFYTLGARGHTSGITLGLGLSKPSKTFYCLDGDGSFLKHLGNITSIGTRPSGNIKHIVFNNEVHESAGGQRSVGGAIDIARIAKACGYTYTKSAKTEAEVVQGIREMQANTSGASLLEVRIRSFTRQDLRGLVMSPRENKQNFMQFLDK